MTRRGRARDARKGRRDRQAQHLHRREVGRSTASSVNSRARQSRLNAIAAERQRWLNRDVSAETQIATLDERARRGARGTGHALRTAGRDRGAPSETPERAQRGRGRAPRPPPTASPRPRTRCASRTARCARRKAGSAAAREDTRPHRSPAGGRPRTPRRIRRTSSARRLECPPEDCLAIVGVSDAAQAGPAHRDGGAAHRQAEGRARAARRRQPARRGRSAGHRRRIRQHGQRSAPTWKRPSSSCAAASSASTRKAASASPRPSTR